jgi:phosphatidylserine/phosphatidylglycerophosphate/cardiolipin synthase-like enzyme
MARRKKNLARERARRAAVDDDEERRASTEDDESQLTKGLTSAVLNSSSRSSLDKSLDSVSVSIDEDASVLRVSGNGAPPVRLLTSYDDVVRAIVNEMDRTAAGDRVEFSVYVMEPGASTDAVLLAMRRAATRGVRVDASLDCSVVSAFTSWCEGTTTQASRLRALAEEFSQLKADEAISHKETDGQKQKQKQKRKQTKRGVVTFSPRTIPTHAKYVVFHRATQTSTAVFGGVNIGDRFKPWRDFAIRAEGRNAVGALAMCVNGEAKPPKRRADGSEPEPDGTRGERGTRGDDVAISLSARAKNKKRSIRPVKQFFTVGSRDRNRFRDAEARRNGLGFVANTPTGFDLVASAAPWLRRFPGTFDVLPALRRLLGDARYDEYVVACAYLDTAGAAVLKLALDRGARVVLVMPRTPNVYRDANAKALKRLMDEHGNFSVSREGEQNASRNPRGATTGDYFSRLFYEEESRKNANDVSSGSGRLTAFVCDDMLHAKVFLARARDRSVPNASMIGSCNLKQRSFGQFAELNALIVQPLLARELECELEAIVAQSERVASEDAEALRYAEPRATIEEWLG